MLSRHTGRRHPKLLYGVGRRQDQPLTPVEVAHGATVEQVVDREVPATVDVHVLLPEGWADRRADPLHSGDETHEVQGIAAVQRKVADAPVVDSHPDLCGSRVDLGRLARDCHRFGDLPELEHKIDPQALEGRERDPRPLRRPEPFGRYGGHVGSHGQLGHQILACHAGLGYPHLAGTLVEERDLDSGNGCSAGIRDNPGYLAGGGLSKGQRTEQ